MYNVVHCVVGFYIVFKCLSDVVRTAVTCVSWEHYSWTSEGHLPAQRAPGKQRPPRIWLSRSPSSVLSSTAPMVSTTRWLHYNILLSKSHDTWCCFEIKMSETGAKKYWKFTWLNGTCVAKLCHNDDDIIVATVLWQVLLLLHLLLLKVYVELSK